MLVRGAELGEMQPAFSLDVHICLRCGLLEVPDQLPRDFFRHHLRMRAPAFWPDHDDAALGLLMQRQPLDGLTVDLIDRWRAERGDSARPHDRSAPGSAKTMSIGTDARAFGPAAVDRLRAEHGPAKLIILHDLLERTGDLHALIEDLLRLLDTDGSIVAEITWSREALRLNAFDLLSAEHVSVFSLSALQSLCAFFDLTIEDVEPGAPGSPSLWVRICRGRPGGASPRVQQCLEQEDLAKLLEPATYDAFADRVCGIKDSLLSALWDMKARGLHVVGYGAAECGNTLLNFCGIGRAELDFLADPDPFKHDMFSPGMKIPIRSLAAMTGSDPDVLVVLDHKLQRCDVLPTARQLNPHGRWLLPLPTPRLLH